VASPKPGARVAELDAMSTGRGPGSPIGSPGEASVALRERARELSKADPARAAHLLRAWIAADTHPEEPSHVR